MSSGPATTARIVPTQQRSRDRMEKILLAATDLIGEAGSDAMKMSELAKRSGISIGSLYQYFPDKRSIIAALAEKCHAEGSHCIAEALAGVTSMEAFRAAFDALIDEYYALFLAEPVMRDVWSGTQADKSLIDIDIRNNRENAAIVTDALLRVQTGLSRDEILPRAFLVMSLGDATMRLAIAVPADEGRVMVDTYKRMALQELTGA
jgi:AcrR family transcriptional regulator